MKKLIFGLIATVMLALNGNAQIVDKSNLNFESVSIDNTIGEKHNQIVSDFLKENEKIKDLNYKERQKVISSYFQKQNDVDVSEILSSFDSYLGSGKVNFDPFEYLNNHKELLSQHFYDRITSILKETSKTNNVSSLKEIVSKYREEAMKDDEFLKNEKETFVNMLYVYESSIDLWYNYNENNQNSTFRISSEHYWQIATCDFIGGISGGIYGAHIGFLIGVVSSSAQAAVCFWE